MEIQENLAVDNDQPKKVIDGSVITIGKKKEEEPFDRTEYAKS